MLGGMKRFEKPSHCQSYDVPGHAHELTFSCYHLYPFLNAQRTCLWLAQAIEQARSELKFYVWAYVFMPEHVHLETISKYPRPC